MLSHILHYFLPSMTFDGHSSGGSKEHLTPILRVIALNTRPIHRPYSAMFLQIHITAYFRPVLNCSEVFSIILYACVSNIDISTILIPSNSLKAVWCLVHFLNSNLVHLACLVLGMLGTGHAFSGRGNSNLKSFRRVSTTTFFSGFIPPSG